MLSCSAFDLRQTYVRAQVSNLLEITLSPNPHSPSMISPANVKRHIWQRFSGFPLPSQGRHLGSYPCIQSSSSLKLPWNSGGFHLTAESAGHTENQERRQNSTCRTQNRTTESIPQTITTQPFSSNLRHSFYWWNWTYSRQWQELQHTSPGQVWVQNVPQDKYSTECPPLMENAEMPGSLVIKQVTKTRRPIGPLSSYRKGHSSSFNMSSVWVPILWKEGYKGTVCEMGVLHMQASEQAWTWCSFIHSALGTI